MTIVSQRWLQRVLVGGLFSVTSAIVCAETAAAASRGYAHDFKDWQQRLEKPAVPIAAPDAEAVPGVVIADGVHLLAEGVATTGYDSNIDHRVSDVDGGAYGLIDLGLALIAGPQSAQSTAVVRGGYGYHDIDYRPDRWDVGVLIDHYRQIAPNTTLNFGGFFLHDDIDTDANERAAGYYELALNSATMDAFWRGRASHSHYLLPAGTAPLSNIFFNRDETFDHVRLEQSAGMLVLKDQRLAPFFEIGYANLDYTHQIDPTVFSRDGDEVWAIGGVRIALSDTLHADIGARYNQRWLDDPNIRSHDTVFFDGKLVWVPNDDLYVELNADRSFLEPVVDTALLTESTTVSLLVNTKLDVVTALKFEIGHITEDQIGAPDKFQHIYSEARITRELAGGTEVFASVLGYHTRNEASDLEANRVDVMAGIRIHN